VSLRRCYWSSAQFETLVVTSRQLLVGCRHKPLANRRSRNNALDTLVAHHVAVIDLFDIGPPVLISALVSPSASIVIAAEEGESAGHEHGGEGDLL